MLGQGGRDDTEGLCRIRNRVLVQHQPEQDLTHILPIAGVQLSLEEVSCGSDQCWRQVFLARQ